MKSPCLSIVLLITISMPVFAQENVSIDVYKGIPVKVTGIPYTWGQISGYKRIDDNVDKAIDMSNWQQSKFVNFSVDGLEIRFESNGDMTMITAYSYDKTPVEGSTSFYPAKTTTKE